VLVAVLAAVGGGVLLVRRRARPVGLSSSPASALPPTSGARSGRLPDVQARPAGMRSGTVEVRHTGPTPDVAVRVVARAAVRTASGGRP
jgi:hypothetical protein